MTEAEQAANLAAHFEHHRKSVAETTPEQERALFRRMADRATASGDKTSFAQWLVSVADALDKKAADLAQMDAETAETTRREAEQMQHNADATTPETKP